MTLTKRINSVTARERQVIKVLCTGVTTGMTIRTIGTKLGISAHTVKRHLANIRLKLNVSDRFELAMFAWQHQLCPLPKPLVKAALAQYQTAQSKRGGNQ
jgi:DNA-binding NarL/FixJ family response regulator